MESTIQIDNNQYFVSDERLKLILDNAGVGLIVLDRNNSHLIVNPTFCGITGFEHKEIIGSSCPASYWPDAFKKELSDILHQLRRSSYIRTESYFQRKDGTIFPVLLIGSVIQDERYNNEAILIVEDITKEKRTESQLQLTHMMLIAMNKDLERKIQERTTEIKELLEQKDEFINQLGHDLKNPLTPITRLLPKISEKITDEKTLERLEVLERNVQHMKNLVIKTIELARLNSSDTNISFECISAYNECEACIVKNKVQLDEKYISVENNISRDINIKADKLRFTELIDNILSNAIKYSPENSKIILYSNVDSNLCTISVKDNGIGMTEDQLSKIFIEFYKADESRHDFDSSGLGMSICKRIIMKHKGKIWAESEGLNKGTTVHFSLPLWGVEEEDGKKNEFVFNIEGITKDQNEIKQK